MHIFTCQYLYYKRVRAESKVEGINQTLNEKMNLNSKFDLVGGGYHSTDSKKRIRGESLDDMLDTVGTRAGTYGWLTCICIYTFMYLYVDVYVHKYLCMYI
jgi:hypothetical protein